MQKYSFVWALKRIKQKEPTWNHLLPNKCKNIFFFMKNLNLVRRMFLSVPHHRGRRRTSRSQKPRLPPPPPPRRRRQSPPRLPPPRPPPALWWAGIPAPRTRCLVCQVCLNVFHLLKCFLTHFWRLINTHLSRLFIHILRTIPITFMVLWMTSW